MSNRLSDQNAMPAPLYGKTVLVTRPRNGAGGPDQLGFQLSRAGATVLSHPVVTVEETADSGPVGRAIKNLARYRCLVFLSQTAVFFFHRQLVQRDSDIHSSSDSQIAAIGDGTATALRQHGYAVDLIPETFNSNSLAELLIENSNGPFLLIRSNRGSDILSRKLGAAELDFDEVAVYESHDATEADPEVLNQLEEGRIDWVTITSTAIARSTIKLFGRLLGQSQLVSISEAVSSELRASGFEVAAQAERARFESIVDAILKAENTCGSK